MLAHEAEELADEHAEVDVDVEEDDRVAESEVGDDNAEDNILVI